MISNVVLYRDKPISTTELCKGLPALLFSYDNIIDEEKT